MPCLTWPRCAPRWRPACARLSPSCTRCVLHLSAVHCILHSSAVAMTVTVLVLVHAYLGCTGCALHSSACHCILGELAVAWCWCSCLHV